MDIRKKLSNVSNFLYEGYQYILLLDFHYLEEWKKKKNNVNSERRYIEVSSRVMCNDFRNEQMLYKLRELRRAV